MAEESKWKHRGSHGTLIGPVWFMGWLFTIGFLQLHFWKAVLGIILWPYYLGVFFR
jgi:hypothetical protein